MFRKIISISFVLIVGSLIFTAAFYLTQKYIDNKFPISDDENVDVIDENNFTLITNEDIGVRLTISKLSPSLIYDQNQTSTVKDIGITNKFEVMTNGGFFLEDNQYAGALIIDSKILSQPAPLDTQLSHVVTFDPISKTYEFIPTTKFNINNGYDLAFQTGPLMILDNIRQDEYISNAINGSGEYLMTFFGVTDEAEVISGITTKKISLELLSDYLLSLDLFQNKKITVINLDGGSSVALYLGESNQKNFGQFKILPVLLGFK
jgi:hypothetical protein